MDDNTFNEILALPHELQGVEFKRAGARTNKPFASNIVQACLGMSNRRGGGHIILGVIQSAQQVVKLEGLSPMEVKTWNHDELSDLLSEYADPSISFDVEQKQNDGKIFVVISISEFSDVPIICKKDYPPDLRRGACYVRSRRKPETTEIPTQEDMRDLLDLAVEKRIRTFISQANVLGILPSGFSSKTDQEKYRTQAKDLLE